MDAQIFFTPGQINAIHALAEEKLARLHSSPERDFTSLDSWCKQTSTSKSKMYKLKAEGRVTFFKFGKNVFVRPKELEQLMIEAK